ncbi:hypothetical protein T03_1110, partial [Trichinella britovi]
LVISSVATLGTICGIIFLVAATALIVSVSAFSLLISAPFGIAVIG